MAGGKPPIFSGGPNPLTPDFGWLDHHPTSFSLWTITPLHVPVAFLWV